MIKICGKTLVYPLKLIFKASIEEGVFSGCWKKANVVPIHKKEIKYLRKNYRLISLLPSFGKIYERIILTLFTNYLHERYQRVVLNGQTSSCELVKSGVPQGSILGPPFFLICINDLPDNFESNCKIFGDDTSLFYKVSDVSRATLNKDLELISNWTFQWKMQFNPDRNKQDQELYFSKKAGNQ